MKKNNFIKVFVAAVLSGLVITTSVPVDVVAATSPYVTYNYDFRNNIVYTPSAYEPVMEIEGSSFQLDGTSIGNFNKPLDICKDPDGRVYIADSGNNRIVVLDDKLEKVIRVIDMFEANGKEEYFSNPSSVATSDDGDVYIADTNKKRIVVLDKNFNFVKFVENPQSEVLEDGFVFKPIKVAVDYAKRVYVISQGQFEGIMVFNEAGNFTGFFGTIEVKISAWDMFWRKIASKAEKENSRRFIPTEFTGIDIDEDGFVYATNIDSQGIQGVKRLNPRGEDVIVKGENANLGGDLVTEGKSDYSGPSQFIDVVYRENGIYSCLDRKRGRVFTYDHEGNLLYIFGGLGTQAGTFSMPVAIDTLGENLIIVDSTRNEVFVFRETEYGALINEAVSLRYSGDETKAVPIWEKVLELNENNELANVGIGKAYLTGGDYVNAMKYLKLGNNRKYYSIAFRRYRNAFLKDIIGYLLTAVLIVIVAFLIIKKVKKKGAK